MGYGEETKGYRLYDTIKKKIVLSRDVIFNEDECVLNREQGEQQHEYLDLDFSSEESRPEK